MTSISLSIPRPCTENWNNMSKTSRGAHCCACKKEVIDFTNWTDTQLINFLSQVDGVCGRVRRDQLRTFGASNERKQKRHWWAGLAFAITFIMGHDVGAQQVRSVATEQLADDADGRRKDKLRNWSAQRSVVLPIMPTMAVRPELHEMMLGGLIVVRKMSISHKVYMSILDWLK